MVLFGTGKYLETADSTSTAVQTFYAIQDNTGATVAKSALSPVSITTTTVSGTSFRVTSTGCGASPLPACPGNPQGWYADLPTSGERVTGVPQLVSGTIFFNTFVPSSTPCDFGGTGWLMGIDFTGGATRPFGVFPNASGTPTAGVFVGAALGGTTLIKSLSPSIGSGSGQGQGGNGPGPLIKSPSSSGTGVSSLPTGNTVTTTLNFGPGSRGRISWREILQ